MYNPLTINHTKSLITHQPMLLPYRNDIKIPWKIYNPSIVNPMKLLITSGGSDKTSKIKESPPLIILGIP